MTADAQSWVLALLVAYLIGSVPFGLLLSHAVGAGDIRKVGSGNIGATNVLRSGRKGLALVTLLLDIAKGIAGIYAAWRLGAKSTDIAHYAMLAAILGHCFPVWLQFKGGKGVATAIGVIIGYYHLVLAVPFYMLLLPLFGVWVLVFAISRFVSLASIVAASSLPLITLYLSGQWQVETAIAVLIIALHRANIQRLMRGEEMGFGKK